MNNKIRSAAFKQIETNIQENGYHLYLIGGGGQEPRYAYTIGIKDKLGFELIFAGAVQFLKDDVEHIIRGIFEHFNSLSNAEYNYVNKDIYIKKFGSFSTVRVDYSWSSELMLGALDYYDLLNIEAIQIIPAKENRTIDVPDMSKPWNANNEPVWQWIHEPWSYRVPKDSTVVTNISALMGERITEVCRWEMDQWEMFAGAGPDVQEADMRVVPLGTLLAHDPSLNQAINLRENEGLWRLSTELIWHEWKAK